MKRLRENLEPGSGPLLFSERETQAEEFENDCARPRVGLTAVNGARRGDWLDWRTVLTTPRCRITHILRHSAHRQPAEDWVAPVLDALRSDNIINMERGSTSRAHARRE